MCGILFYFYQCALLDKDIWCHSDVILLESLFHQILLVLISPCIFLTLISWHIGVLEIFLPPMFASFFCLPQYLVDWCVHACLGGKALQDLELIILDFLGNLPPILGMIWAIYWANILIDNISYLVSLSAIPILHFATMYWPISEALPQSESWTQWIPVSVNLMVSECFYTAIINASLLFLSTDRNFRPLQLSVDGTSHGTSWLGILDGNFNML